MTTLNYRSCLPVRFPNFGRAYGTVVVLEVVTRTADRPIYSYNRSALVPPEAPMLTLTGAPGVR